VGSKSAIEIQHDTGGDFPALRKLTLYENGTIELMDGSKRLCRHVPAGDGDLSLILVLLRQPQTQRALESMAERNRAQQPSGEFLRIRRADTFVLTRPHKLEPPVDEVVRLMDMLASRAFGRRWVSIGRN
jgi:hypothetical protein